MIFDNLVFALNNCTGWTIEKSGIQTSGRWHEKPSRLTCCRRDVGSASSRRGRRTKVGRRRCATSFRTSPCPGATRPRSRPAAVAAAGAAAAAATSSAAGDADDCDDCDDHSLSRNRPSWKYLAGKMNSTNMKK